jgi:serine/threonine protein kinase
MANASSRALVGSVLSQRWRVVQKLGDGAIGEVYAAEPVLGGARVALKVLRPEFSDAIVRARFVEEARACMRLLHPNIVRVIECAAAENGSPYIVMDLLEGVPLGAYTQSGGRVPVAQAVAILHGVLAGLAAAHAQGIVHHDLKPDNVFLMRHAGGTFIVKVLDFGIAKVMDAAGGIGGRARSGMSLGTRAYVSPEQAKNASDADKRADLWSAGVIFYEMLTGRAAFPAPTEYARLQAILSTEPEPIDRIDPALAALAPLVRRALQKNRDHRFPSALEMARALAAAMPHESARTEGAVGVMSPLGMGPLTHMPHVPSLLAPSVLAQTAPAPSPPQTAPIGREKPGGTLASAVESDPPVEQPPQVTVAIGETLPSKDLPVLVRGAMRAARVRRGVVVILVAISLAAGFLFGWAFARAH